MLSGPRIARMFVFRKPGRGRQKTSPSLKAILGRDLATMMKRRTDLSRRGKAEDPVCSYSSGPVTIPSRLEVPCRLVGGCICAAL